MKYAVNEEGVQALRTMSILVTDSRDTLLREVTKLYAVAEEHTSTLGPHAKQLLNMLKEYFLILKDASGSVDGISEKLNETADGYQDIIDNNALSGVSSDSDDSAPQKVKSHLHG